MELRRFVGLALLIAAVPLQMYLMNNNENFKELVADIVKTLPENIRGLTVDLTEYVKAAKGYIRSVFSYFHTTISDEDDGDDDNDDDDEDVTNDDGSLSEKNGEVPEHMVRNFRPPHLEFRVGDVVLTRTMAIGVIVGWKIDMSDLSREPEYYMLVDIDDNEFIEVQKNMIGLENVEVRHKNINQYFKKFDGIRYTPKKWLQKFYPKD
ncbi:Hemimethylated DNA-binding domain [Cinara cedri]|uniref:Hemimethylated DNA-binding domain n=1 Tax=Cinara cedri TaxID=506608 RepID=A0A5E4N9K7_9HEMI|nr:Hemimethylated DNA-binding domain [Cinara cedri]